MLQDSMQLRAPPDTISKSVASRRIIEQKVAWSNPLSLGKTLAGGLADPCQTFGDDADHCQHFCGLLLLNQDWRLVDNARCQQGAHLADQVLQYRSQAHLLRKPRSAGRRPAIPSPHQPCLAIPEDQASLSV